MQRDLDAFENRTQTFNVQVIKLCERLAGLPHLRTSMSQLNDAAGSVGANHRAMRRARSNREFYAKVSIVCEESDESVYWLEVLERTCPASLSDSVLTLLKEARELRAMFSSARRNTRDKR